MELAETDYQDRMVEGLRELSCRVQQALLLVPPLTWLRMEGEVGLDQMHIIHSVLIGVLPLLLDAVFRCLVIPAIQGRGHPRLFRFPQQRHSVELRMLHLLVDRMELHMLYLLEPTLQSLLVTQLPSMEQEETVKLMAKLDLCLCLLLFLLHVTKELQLKATSNPTPAVSSLMAQQSPNWVSTLFL
jgi:hypothetical protein